MKKKLILVTSPPASGKTYVSKQLAKNLKNCVYLDKDTLIVLSKKIFEVANEEFNRSSEFFEANIRNEEYYAIVDLATEAIEYNDTVLINAPFTREIRDDQYLNSLREKLAQKDAELSVVWVHTDPEVVHQRMIERNSDRDTWKLQNWDEYIKTQNFDPPNNIPELIIFNNSSEADFNESIEMIKAAYGKVEIA
ncbi:AAA family ATPase [Clostridium cellulovorans]|uniref:p-loop ATPase n=1 Tax=Clostridium cellulovorans (strain ATCC 35296 / DSM 3052 / OCM 3 / 743B) TaxID=573061 RepID=D9SVJ0_CLOC7|nr:AAA family ATPase [Clostridium cellulovorans]ADL51114.1 P-loop ATPase [Clostridium cellulovorans 743B]